MAISNIIITQDNIVSGSNLMPVHSPLIFIAEATYSGQTPDTLTARIYDIDDNLLNEYKAIPYEDPLATVRSFLFDSDLFLRSYMEDFDDELQLIDSVFFVSGPTKEFKISFYDADTLIESTKLVINAIAGVAQFGQYPNLLHIFNNEAQTYISKKDAFVYVYYFNEAEDTILQITKDGNFISGTNLPNIGYYRYKTVIDKSMIINFTDDGSINVDHSIIAQGCEDDALIKYIDKSGQYRFFNFNEYYETNNRHKSIGTIENLITNIRTDQSSVSQIGKETSQEISLVAEVENDQLNLLDELICSPNVYLYTGTLTSDQAQDWLKVEVLTNDSLIRRRVGTSGRADIAIKLPEIYNVTRL